MKDIEKFYQSPLGQMICDELAADILSVPNVVENLQKDILSVGYGVGFETLLTELATKKYAVHHAITTQKKLTVSSKSSHNNICLSEQYRLPFRDDMFSVCLVVHGLERATLAADFMREIWRVLDDRGIAILIVPNRAGFWARGDENPFGAGKPYSQSQVERFFQDFVFDVLNVRQSLYTPPCTSAWLLKIAPFLQKIFRLIVPIWGGVHIVTLQKNRTAMIGKMTRVEHYNAKPAVAATVKYSEKNRASD